MNTSTTLINTPITGNQCMSCLGQKCTLRKNMKAEVACVTVALTNLSPQEGDSKI